MVSIASKLVRCGRPSGKICAACVNLLRSFCASCRVCVLLADHSCKADRYLSCFPLASNTVRHSKYQVKPMKVGVLEKGMSFDGSQGTSRVFDMLSTSAKLYR